MFVFKEKKKEPNFTVLADGTVEKALEDGAIERDFADGHHEVIDADGNIELDDLDSDKDSYCEEVDVRDADGNVHHVKNGIITLWTISRSMVISMVLLLLWLVLP